MPFIAVGFLLSLAMAVVHETVGPRCGYLAAQFLQYQRHQESAHIENDIAFYNTADSRNWFMGSFNTKTFDMTNVRVAQEHGQGQAQTKYNAGRAERMDGHWWLFDVTIQELDAEGDPVRLFDAAGHPIGILRHEAALEMPEFTEDPHDFVNITKNPEFLTSWELWDYIRANAEASDATIDRVKVDLHRRLAMPWMALVVTLIGIPFGTQTARKGALTGVMLTMSMFFGYYFLINMGLWMGKELMIPAWLAGWLPNLLFTGIGSALLYRMR
jgi:lipopolysaccharide export LptBFGC system permease protein LptF